MNSARLHLQLIVANLIEQRRRYHAHVPPPGRVQLVDVAHVVRLPREEQEERDTARLDDAPGATPVGVLRGIGDEEELGGREQGGGGGEKCVLFVVLSAFFSSI